MIPVTVRESTFLSSLDKQQKLWSMSLWVCPTIKNPISICNQSSYFHIHSYQNCKRSLGDITPSFCPSSWSVISSVVIVKLQSWDHWRKLKYLKLPRPCTKLPVRWVRRLHRFWQALGVRTICGRLVLFWSIPSIITDSTSRGFSTPRWQLV